MPGKEFLLEGEIILYFLWSLNVALKVFYDEKNVSVINILSFSFSEVKKMWETKYLKVKFL